MKIQLSDIISDEVFNLFRVMFDVEVSLCQRENLDLDDDSLVSKIVMHQKENNLEVVLRFAFPRHVLTPLLKKIYDPIMASHESVYEDSVNEITNIVCSGLKKFLNETGHHLEMGLPEIDNNFNDSDPSEPNKISMDFLVQDDMFHVQLRMDEESDKGVNIT